jgi:hypothetical protein
MVSETLSDEKARNWDELIAFAGTRYAAPQMGMGVH